ncbi:DHA2 family efflux MFS transporter permease subunit [Brevibacillus fluminis]|uniref:DHA2 family efflux MFS transporter permease subunit n=1 Tax=Brevibacillus fluminis TaxID=511487 RepID=A0A3M8DW77_9BACL|nr:MDR family MFS transporter [Brevibacillus fluminis]RNB92420.1 DHA2 family efflux MFS transporter permease subunit [Brevibacillus fluminis]
MDQKKTNTTLTVVGLMLGLLLAALDQTIVSTAMPTILGIFGGLDKFVWVYSAYLIASVVGMPIFGKLSDMYGRKRFFVLGLVIFMLGSALCGTAQSMTQLILYRAIQGIGGGALMPIVFTIVFDIFPPEKRGKMQGLFGAVFGLSSVLGPLAGAFFTDYVNWRWCFYVNLPLGIVSLILIYMSYHETRSSHKQKIDLLGTVLMALSVMCLMFGLELGGKEYAWGSGQIIGLFAGFVIFLIVFLLWERKASSPIVTLSLFHDRLFTASMGIAFFYGAIMISGATYIPLFIQGVFSGSATSAGLVLTPMMLGVVASSMVGGRFIGKASYRAIMFVSVALIIIAVALLGTISIETKQWVVTLYMILMGFGMGASFPIISTSALHNVDFKMRGSANSMNTFFRSIGSAIGVTVFGSLQTHQLGISIQQLVPPQFAEKLGDGRGLLQESVKNAIPADLYHTLLSALADSIAFVYQWAILIGVLAAVCIFFMGNAKLQLPGKAKEKAPQ